MLDPTALVLATPPHDPAALETLDDAALVVQAQAGDREAWGVLWQRWHERIETYLRYHLNSRYHRAEDFAAEVFTRALAKLGTYRPQPGAPFSAWLYRIAHNYLIDELRRDANAPIVPLFSPNGATKLRPTDAVRTQFPEVSSLEDRTAPALLAASERAGVLEQALASLTRDQRAVIAARFGADQSIKVTAARLGKHENAIKQLQVRALRNMRRDLQRVGITSLAEWWA